MLQCLVAGDADGAATAMREHVNLLGEKLLDFIAVFHKRSTGDAVS